MGLGIATLAVLVGAVLAFAPVDFPGETDLLGWVLLVAGVAGAVVALAVHAHRHSRIPERFIPPRRR